MTWQSQYKRSESESQPKAVLQIEQRPKKLLDQVRETIQLKHYSRRTEEAYVNWIKRYILVHNKRHPKYLGAPEVEAFLCMAAAYA